MPREKAAYRENLQDILEFTKGRRLLSIGEVRDYVGLSSYAAVKRLFPFRNHYISAVTLAKCLAGGEEE